jgi:hypothetical protein
MRHCYRPAEYLPRAACRDALPTLNVRLRSPEPRGYSGPLHMATVDQGIGPDGLIACLAGRGGRQATRAARIARLTWAVHTTDNGNVWSGLADLTEHAAGVNRSRDGVFWLGSGKFEAMAEDCPRRKHPLCATSITPMCLRPGRLSPPACGHSSEIHHQSSRTRLRPAGPSAPTTAPRRRTPPWHGTRWPPESAYSAPCERGPDRLLRLSAGRCTGRVARVESAQW